MVDDKPIRVALNWNLGSPTAPGEATEKDPDEESELWQESVRAYVARREEELRAAWCQHHQEQAARLKAVLEGLISRHEAEAERYLAKGA